MLPYTQPAPFHSQWGEDRWLAEHYHIPTTGIFVDVGAGDGVRGSNTFYFENLGWRGLCVDADPRNHEPLRRTRHCIVDTCAASSTAGIRRFGMYADRPSRSGLLRYGPDYSEVTVTCRRLDDLLQRSSIQLIDLLSIDVEGSELDVWASFDPDKHRPAMIVIEVDDRDQATSRDTVQQRLGHDAYRLVHQTPANLIMQRLDRPWRRRT